MMEDNKDNFGFGENIPDPEQIRHQYPIEDDSDTLEPIEDEATHQTINVDDPADMKRWAHEFKINEAELKAAIVLNGNAVGEIKKYLNG